MSGRARCAITAPSTNSTRLWTMLSLCSTTSSISGFRSNSHRASISSSPLFIRVAESTVTFSPIFQVGCASACSGVTRSSSSSGRSRKAPPDAVSTTRATDSRAWPSSDWNIAECSLSTGSSRAPDRAASAAIRCLATTSGSLFASAIVLPARTASHTGRSPATPTAAATTRSASGCMAHRVTPSIPAATSIPLPRSASAARPAAFSSATATSFGLYRFACATTSSTDRWQAKATTRKRSGKESITSSVWRPIEPVEPSSAMCFVEAIRPFRVPPGSFRQAGPPPR